jgi:DNA-binding NtrC family response regulator
VKILVAEDEELLRDIILLMLQDVGFECVTAADGDLARQALAAEHFDIVLSDIRMPGHMNGFKLLDYVRHVYPRIPVILMSGWYDDLDSAQSIRPRLPVLRKPFLREGLEKALRAAEELINSDLVPWASKDVTPPPLG